MPVTNRTGTSSAIDQKTNFCPALKRSTSGTWPPLHSPARGRWHASRRYHPSAVPQIVAPELHDQSGVADQQHDPDPRMDRPRPLAPAEQCREPEQQRMKHREGLTAAAARQLAPPVIQSVDPGRGCGLPGSASPLGRVIADHPRLAYPREMRLSFPLPPASLRLHLVWPDDDPVEEPGERRGKAMPANASGF